MLGAVLGYGALGGADAARLGGRARGRAGAPAHPLRRARRGTEGPARRRRSRCRRGRALRPRGGRRRRRVRRATSSPMSGTTTCRMPGSATSRSTAARAAWRSSASPATARPRCCRCHASASGAQRASLVWCVPRNDDPVRELDDAQRVAVLNTVFDPRVGRIDRGLGAEVLSARPGRTAQPRARPPGAHRQRRADPASRGRPGPQPRPARRLRAGHRACATPSTRAAPRPTSMPPCHAWPGSARPTAGR